MLKFKLNQEDFDKLNDVEKTFYAQSGDGYQLQVEGATDKTKLDEFRASNVDLMKKQKELEGVDLAKYRAMEETERKVRDKELIDRGEFDTLIQERTQALQQDWEGKYTNATSQLEEYKSKYETTVSKHEIEGAAFKAFGAHNIRPEANEAIMAQIRNTFSLDNGQVVAKSGDSILSGVNGNLTIDEFVSQQPDFMRIANDPGRGDRNKTEGVMSQGNSSRDKITSGLSKMMSKG